MPTYTFINQATGDIEDHFMAISELDDFVKTNPQLERVLTAPAIVGSVSIKDKEPQGLKMLCLGLLKQSWFKSWQV